MHPHTRQFSPASSSQCEISPRFTIETAMIQSDQLTLQASALDVMPRKLSILDGFFSESIPGKLSDEVIFSPTHVFGAEFTSPSLQMAQQPVPVLQLHHSSALQLSQPVLMSQPHIVPSPGIEAESLGVCDVIDAALEVPRRRVMVWCDECDICGKQFFKTGSLVRHKRAAHKRTLNKVGQRFHCPHPQCSTTFSQKGSLNRHVRSIHSYLKLRCKYCSQSFGQSFDLKRHQSRKHPNNTPFIPPHALPVPSHSFWL